MDNSSKNTKNHPNLESCGKIRENGLFSGEFADKKRKWKSKSCSEDLINALVGVIDYIHVIKQFHVKTASIIPSLPIVHILLLVH